MEPRLALLLVLDLGVCGAVLTAELGNVTAFDGAADEDEVVVRVPTADAPVRERETLFTTFLGGKDVLVDNANVVVGGGGGRGGDFSGVEESGLVVALCC